MLAGLLYLGSGIGLGLIGLGARLSGRAAEARLRRRDLPWLGLIVLFGGVLGPAPLMAGLTSASGGAGSLLLNTESLATMAIAWIFFRETVDRRVFAGAIGHTRRRARTVLASRRCGDDCRLGRCADRRGLHLLGHR